MPTSSTSNKQSSLASRLSGSGNRRTYWPNQPLSSAAGQPEPRASQLQKNLNQSIRSGGTTFSANLTRVAEKPATGGKKTQVHSEKQTTTGLPIKSISSPSCASSTAASVAIAAMLQARGTNAEIRAQAKASSELESINVKQQSVGATNRCSHLTDTGAIITGNDNAGLYNEQLVAPKNSLAQSTQTLASTTNSTVQLHPRALLGETVTHHHQRASRGSSQKVRLTYIKTLIIILLAADLLLTLFVYHYSSQDQLSVLGLKTLKVRFSLLNLLLSAIWFAVLIAGIIFDVYLILFVSCLVNGASFVLLLILSSYHFARRLDYSNVQLTSLLIQLFSIILLHLYLLAMLVLNIHLMAAIRRRQRRPSHLNSPSSCSLAK